MSSVVVEEHAMSPTELAKFKVRSKKKKKKKKKKKREKERKRDDRQMILFSPFV